MDRLKVCLVGQIIIDVFAVKGIPVVRFGGAMHAARGLWAIRTPYSLAYIAPSYMDSDIRGYARRIKALDAVNVGTVVGCPNVLLVGDPLETGDQNYEMLLEKHFRSKIDLNAIRKLCADATDILILPGGFDLKSVLRALKKLPARMHIDSNLEPANAEIFSALGRNISTIMISTSSAPFLERFKGSAARLCKELTKCAEQILLKENRGGSRFFQAPFHDNPVSTPSHPRKISHSIGVGDCFDAIFIGLQRAYGVRAALAYASLIAAEYACELDLEPFHQAVKSVLNIPKSEAVAFRGIELPWEDRPACNVYVAAPDFAMIDKRHIDAVVQSLKYHNFSPRRPVREHGEVAENANVNVKTRTARADLSLLARCQIVVAVLLFDDPGTLIEIGIALEKRIPVIVYDPRRIASNLVLATLPDVVSSDLDEVITEVFSFAAAARHEK